MVPSNTLVQRLMTDWGECADPYDVTVLTRYVTILGDSIGLVTLTLTLFVAH